MQFQKHLNPIDYNQCPEFSTTPAVFISGTTSREERFMALETSVDVVPLMETACVVENSGHCTYSIGLRCF